MGSMMLKSWSYGASQEAIDKGIFRTAPTPMAPPCMAVILRTALDIARGISFLHSHDILHCDVSSGAENPRAMQDFFSSHDPFEHDHPVW